MAYQMCRSLRTHNFTTQKQLFLKVHNDINLNIDNDKVTALTLLDISAAFTPLPTTFSLDVFQLGAAYLTQP